ncbi:hypothetical protein, partial [Pectobacterium versatile]
MSLDIKLLESDEPEDSFFLIKDDSSELLLLFRLLSGSCDIAKVDGSERKSLSTNYFFPIVNSGAEQEQEQE